MRTSGGVRVVADGPQEAGQFLGADVGIVGGPAALQKAAQALDGIVLAAPGDPGQIVDFAAIAANPAGLGKDPFALQASEKLHPFQGLDVVERPVGKDREDMFLQGRENLFTRAGLPARKARAVPFARQAFEGILACQACLELARQPAGAGALAGRNVGIQFVRLFAGERTAYSRVAAQSQPGPFSVVPLVAQLPGFLAAGLYPQVQAFAVQHAIDDGLGLQVEQHRVGQGTFLHILALHRSAPQSPDARLSRWSAYHCIIVRRCTRYWALL